MGARREAPVDEHGVPLALYPNERLERHSPHVEDPAFYSRQARGRHDSAIQAARSSRTFRVGRSIQDRKMRAFPHGTAHFPTTPADVFAPLVFIAGEYLSREAIDVRDPYDPQQITMSQTVYDRVRARMHPDPNAASTNPGRWTGHDLIRRFLARHLIAQAPQFAERRQVHQFIGSPRRTTRLQAGFAIVDASLAGSVEQLAPGYKEAHREGLTNPFLPTPRAAIEALFPRDEWASYFRQLHTQLLMAHLQAEQVSVLAAAGN